MASDPTGRRIWRTLAALSVAAVVLLLVACGGGDDGSDPAPTTSPTTPSRSPTVAPGTTPTVQVDEEMGDREDELRQVALEAVEAYIDGDNAKAYTFLAADYRERCSFDEYLGVLLFAAAFLGDISEAEATVEGVRFEGERAFADISLSLNGVDLFGDDEEDEYPDYWVLEAGEWKSTSDDPAPCELDFGDDAGE